MALVVPPIDDFDRLLNPLNDGERRVAIGLLEMDDAWTVYVQPRLGVDIPDFVAVHAVHGVCVIEVKDWAYNKYRNNNGVIEYGSKDGWTQVKEHPRYQAYRYRSTIFERFFAFPEDGELISPTVRGVVILLNHSTRKAQDLLRSAGRSPWSSIEVYGEEALDALETALIGPAPATPTARSVAKLRKHLIDGANVARLIQPHKLSPSARNVETNPSKAKMRRIRGSAGCGKSYGLAARAARLAAEGKDVLVLSYNSTLARYLQSLVSMHCATYGANPARVSCIHFYGFCSGVAGEASAVGFDLVVPDGVDGFEIPVARARSAFEQGFERAYDAILVDEGQDFELDWWNLLRNHVRADDGEMLLVSDPTQNIYGKVSWTEEVAMLGAGFAGPWTELGDSYRIPADMISVLRRFGTEYISGDIAGPSLPSDADEIRGAGAPTVRRWLNIRSAAELGSRIGDMTADLLDGDHDLTPSDVVFLCETHQQGLAAVRRLEARGHDVHHIFGADAAERRRRMDRFWPDAPGVKGCTVHSFKGWEARGVIAGIGTSDGSRRLAYVAMTRLKSDPIGREAFIGIVNADQSLNDFRELFKHGIPLPPPRLQAVS